MTDKDSFIALLKKSHDPADWFEIQKSDPDFPAQEDLADGRCETRICVLPGYRAHFEAEFDAQGNILNIGQLDEL